MKGLYKRSSHWCFGCDRYYVSIGEKCPVCGQVAIGKKIRPKILIGFKDYEELERVSA